MTNVKSSLKSPETYPVLIIIACCLAAAGYLFLEQVGLHEALVMKALSLATDQAGLDKVSELSADSMKGMISSLSAVGTAMVGAIALLWKRLGHKEQFNRDALNAGKIAYINEPVN